MSDRETVIEFIRQLPEETPLMEIARKVELLASIENTQQQARPREGISAKEARKFVDSVPLTTFGTGGVLPGVNLDDSAALQDLISNPA